MKRFRSVRPLLASLAATLLLVGLLPGAAQGAAPQGVGLAQHDRHGDRDRHDDDRDRHRGLVDLIRLPDGFQPEGIAIDGRRAYFGSLADGDIYAASLSTGRGRVISQGPDTPSVGLKVDQRDRLWVAGGPAGDARVISARSGRVLASYEFVEDPSEENPSFINDVVLTRRTAWFTDSFNPVLYGVPLERGRSLADQDDVITLELGGEYQHVTGPNAFNLNGIERTPDGRALLAIQSATGTLFRIDARTGDATAVDLGGATLDFGDGLLLDGRILYVVQNQLDQVAVVKLNRSGTKGEVVDTLTDDRLDVPTTVARTGDSLYLPNARFGTVPDPTTAEYTAVRIDAFRSHRHR